MFHQDHHALVFSLVMSVFLGATISFILGLINIGLTTGFIEFFVTSLITSLAIAWPASYIFTPIVFKITESAVKKDKSKK